MFLEIVASLIPEPAAVVEPCLEVCVDDALHLPEVAVAHLGLSPYKEKQRKEQEQQARDEVLRIGVEQRLDAPALVELLLVERRVVEDAIGTDEADLLVEDGQELWLHATRDADGDILRECEDTAGDELWEITLPDVLLCRLLPQEGDVGIAAADGAQAFLSRRIVANLVFAVALQQDVVGRLLGQAGDARLIFKAAAPRDRRVVRSQVDSREVHIVGGRPADIPVGIEQDLCLAGAEVLVG